MSHFQLTIKNKSLFKLWFSNNDFDWEIKDLNMNFFCKYSQALKQSHPMPQNAGVNSYCHNLRQLLTHLIRYLNTISWGAWHWNHGLQPRFTMRYWHSFIHLHWTSTTLKFKWPGHSWISSLRVYLIKLYLKPILSVKRKKPYQLLELRESYSIDIIFKKLKMWTTEAIIPPSTSREAKRKG